MTIGDYYKYAVNHEQQLRNQLYAPSAQTLMMQRILDQRRKAREEDPEAEDFEIHFKSEVKVK